MSFNLSDYYKALNGESTETSGIWHINNDKRHAYRISSDFDALAGSDDKISLPPSESETETIDFFSDKLGQKFKNTKITDNGDGTESIDLELDGRIVTIVMDQSGSMTWNDNNKFRHDVVTDLVNKIEINYPGDVAYNLIEYGSDIIDVLLFGVVENDAFDPNSIDSLSTMISADDEANYDGMRIIRNDSHYPANAIDGEIVDEGFISRIKDTGLVEGQTYYYTVYTYDKKFKFSEGIQIKVTPKERIVPRSHSNFRSIVELEEVVGGDLIATSVPMIGSGVNRDANTIGIWHMDEGEGQFVYDFSDTGAILEFSKEVPEWYESKEVPSGTSGLSFDGANDYVGVDGVSDLYFDLTTNRPQITVMAWVFPYSDSGIQTIISSATDSIDSYQLFFQNKKLFFQGHAGSFIQSGASDFDVLELNKWQHICATYDYNGGSEIINLYHNGQLIDSTLSPIGPLPGVVSEHRFTVGANRTSSSTQYYFYGDITEVSVHDVVRSSAYINAQIIPDPIYDSNNVQVGSQAIGIKDDNGDRLNVFKYYVPRDYNYVGGEVICVKNEKNIPSWEEDGTVIYQQSDPGSGQFFISDPDDYVLGEKYYYRLFTKNALGNVSFLTDSPSLTIEIPLITASTEIADADYRVALSSFIKSPEAPTDGKLITAGNKKTYLRWKQNDNLDSRIARVKIFYSSIDSPDINAIAGNAGLVFTGLPTDTKFVHRSPANDQNAFYTIVNVDKYDRACNYDNDGKRVLGQEPLYASAIPSFDANENTFPLVEVENINYELVNENTVTIGWNQPQKSIEIVNAFFDQTVYIYGAITDEFGDPVSEDTPIKMSITSLIEKEEQADDVFNAIGTTEFVDIDAYDFFVTRTSDGFFKGILRITSDTNIVSQIVKADFQIQLKVLLPKEGGYNPPNDATIGSDPVLEYASLLEELIDDIDNGGETETATSDNFYEYHSEIISVSFTNPWEVELVSRDSQTVYERCYCQRDNDLAGTTRLELVKEFYNGVYIRATNPFVARAKVKYKGLPVESGNIQIAVWDAELDSGKICATACKPIKPGEDPPPPYEGPVIGDRPSVTVPPPDSLLPIIQGREETFKDSGVLRDISFVDIPIYAPNLPQAARLFVKGEKSGYSSVKDMYILFQNILQIDIDTSNENLTVNGKDIAEFRANAFIIDPDYPNYDVDGSPDQSLVTYPEDETIVEWKSYRVQTLPIPSNNSIFQEFAEPSGIGPIYSTAGLSIPNGIYSHTLSGTARNVFMGPLAKGDKAVFEIHEISSSIVYQGLSSSARIFFTVGLYNPLAFDSTTARFLMEVDGGWGYKPMPNQEYGGGGWRTVDNWPLWADGIHYKKMKISRNPRDAVQGTGVDEFAYADCFRDCVTYYDELLKLDPGTSVEVGFNLNSLSEEFSVPQDAEIEILHGEIYEMEDPYTGLHYLEVGEAGFIDYGTAPITINPEEVSDVTYFYIRINKFVPGSKIIDNSEDCDFPEEIIVNDCGCLDKDADGNGDGVITECDIPEWSPMMFVQGSTIAVLNNDPIVLQGGGTIENGIPPCPIGLNEPLRMRTIERKVTDFFVSEEFGNPSNDFLYPVETFTDKDNFLDDNNKTIVKHNSDVDIRVEVLWRGQNIPDGTPIYVLTGDNTASSLFVSSQSVYYTTTVGENYSYVDVNLLARRYIDDTRTEQIEIFSIYDESGKTERHVGNTFSITLDKGDKEIEPPVLETDPSVGVITPPPPPRPYSGTVHRYDILTDNWTRVANMLEPKGNGFSGSVGNYIYYMGGLLGNDFSISSKSEQYDILNDEWSDVSSMSAGRFAGMSVTIGNDIYVIGGIFVNDQAGGDFAVSTLVEVYHTDTDVWEELESLPTIGAGGAFEDRIGVAFGTAAHVFMNGKNYIYIIGGVKSVTFTENQFAVKKYNKRILRYCVEDNEWENSNILISIELNAYERISPKSIVFDNKIIVFEGAYLPPNAEDFIYPSQDFYIDIQVPFTTPSSGEWINVGSGLMGGFPKPKYQSAMAEYDLNPSNDNANYYIFGGSNSDSLSLDILENIDVKDEGFIYKTSYTITDPSIDLTAIPTGKHGASVEFSDASGSPYIYLMGGYTDNTDPDHISIIIG